MKACLGNGTGSPSGGATGNRGHAQEDAEDLDPIQQLLLENQRSSGGKQQQHPKQSPRSERQKEEREFERGKNYGSPREPAEVDESAIDLIAQLLSQQSPDKRNSNLEQLLNRQRARPARNH